MSEKMICKNCKNFHSYREIYEDELEPEDCGTCDLKLFGNNSVNCDDSCNKFFENKNY